ncbi:hypothetical protein M407DRAFT_34886 [Tulasnella calospora MUT 4182]|uniref:Uncharacterized protein n=1 Tax=Tulasnella calospora MUT 4182 TaxID=1051891 RepID=A0A0C3K278_9AGAM|nr:hypothetical protein M407DRAFT_34886 [Tulasnella calospora MUT 4182]
MIIVDLFTFASANRSELVTLVVISGDPDLAYALSLLRQRHCKITLISPHLNSKDTGIAPGHQADDILTWEVILKDQEPLPLGQARNIPPSSSATISSVPSMHRQSTSEPAPKPAVPLVQANARADRPVIRLGDNAGTVGARTAPLDRPPTAPNQQPPAIKPVVLASTIPFTSSSGNIPQTPIPSSSSIPAVDHRTTNPVATGENNAGGSQNFTRASVPEHLHGLITVLLTAKKPRGWPKEEIYGQLHLLNKTKWNDPAVVATYLAEAVQLGIFVQSVGLSKNQREHTYYAIAETLKNNWR